MIGSNLSWRGSWDRFVRMLRGEYREWNQVNVAALSRQAPVLTGANRAVLEAFGRARQAPGGDAWAGCAAEASSGQKPSDQLLLWLACVLRRI